VKSVDLLAAGVLPNSRKIFSGMGRAFLFFVKVAGFGAFGIRRSETCGKTCDFGQADATIRIDVFRHFG